MKNLGSNLLFSQTELITSSLAKSGCNPGCHSICYRTGYQSLRSNDKKSTISTISKIPRMVDPVEKLLIRLQQVAGNSSISGEETSSVKPLGWGFLTKPCPSFAQWCLAAQGRCTLQSCTALTLEKPFFLQHSLPSVVWKGSASQLLSGAAGGWEAAVAGGKPCEGECARASVWGV